MELVIAGERADENGHLFGAELWRTPFLGWGRVHRFEAQIWTRPRRYTVLDARGTVVAGEYLDGSPLEPGGLLELTVPDPSSTSATTA